MLNRSLLLLSLALAAACGDSAGVPAPPPAAPSVAAPAPAVDAVGEAAASYRVRAAISPSEAARGGKATLAIDIEVLRPDVHVQREFPLKIALAPSAGLALGKAALGHADAVDPAARGRRWEVPVAPKAAGPQQIEAVLRFALCKETEPAWCVTRSETALVSLQVR